MNYELDDLIVESDRINGMVLSLRSKVSQFSGTEQVENLLLQVSDILDDVYKQLEDLERG